MKRTLYSLLAAGILLGLLAGCESKASSTLVVTPSASAIPQAEPIDPSLPLPGVEEEEPNTTDTPAGALMQDNEIVSEELGFSMAAPEGWSHLTAGEVGLGDTYIYAASNRATGATLQVYSVPRAANVEYASYSSVLQDSIGETVDLYKTMGLATSVDEPGATKLGGQPAYSLTMQVTSEELTFDVHAWLVQAPNNEGVMVYLTTYDDADFATASAALVTIEFS